jgi:hypothetical protein
MSNNEIYDIVNDIVMFKSQLIIFSDGEESMHIDN